MLLSCAFCLLFSASALASRSSATFPYDNDTALIDYDAMGAYVNCASTYLFDSQSRRCYLPPKKVVKNDTYGLACYTLWYKDNSSGSVKVQKGCWVNQEVSLQDQCDMQSCVSRKSKQGYHFCCCFGHDCNKQFDETKMVSTESNNVNEAMTTSEPIQ